MTGRAYPPAPVVGSLIDVAAPVGGTAVRAITPPEMLNHSHKPLGPSIASLQASGHLPQTPEQKQALHEFTHARPTPLLTDWIPCTTPPVRVGEYEVQLAGNDVSSGRRALWKNGVWTWVHSSSACGGPNDVILRAKWMWRGVRRWVLTVPALAPQEPCDQVKQDRAYVAHVSKRGVLYLTDRLAEPTSSSYKYLAALSFTTEADAVAYATKHARHLRGWKAVLA